ncbi:MAG TPA: glycosyltransferase family 2 protein [Verrucomicrobiae bacterium]|jgi:glycosyltransferase involved in cell wall biosynthesis|nr:glycosyltransferase family 2 protein [Verrucomicrobiae bacterium]
MNYVLITSARNEESYIRKTLDSVVTQTQLPKRWVIIDDGSTDRTRDIVEEYAGRFPWMTLIRRANRTDRNFGGKADAVNAAYKILENDEFDLVGNLDADISFGTDHFEFLLGRFSTDSRLGVAGTAYLEKNWDSTRDSFEGETSVHGACQLFRRECFEQIGGYIPNPEGGIDWIAVTTARMMGWTTQNFPERRFYHHRNTGTAKRDAVGAMFDYGMKDYYLGGSPVWELFRVLFRLCKHPFILGGLALLCGYTWAAFKRTKRPVSRELMSFHRREQMLKLRALFRAVIRLDKVEPFRLAASHDKLPQ